MDFKSSIKVKDFRQFYIYLLIAASFVSIGLFEVLIAIGFLVSLYDFFGKRAYKKDGYLKIPILGYSISSFISSLIFAPKRVLKAVEEVLYLFVYFFEVKVTKEFLFKILLVFIAFGIIILFPAIYKFLKVGETKGFWGGSFEIGQYYGEISIIAFLLFYSFKDRFNKFWRWLLLFYSMMSFTMLILTHRRSPLLGFLIASAILIVVLYKNKFISKRFIFTLFAVFTVMLSAGYIYLSITDIRFKTFNEMVVGKKPFDFEVLNRVASSRVGIGKDAVEIVKSDLENKNIANLLIGHGIRSGYYLPHKLSPKNWEKYESFFILSEFIEKGIVGLFFELWLIFSILKFVFSVKIGSYDEVALLGIFAPILVHIGGILFTFFWDALFPMYLLLFKIGEVYFKSYGEYNGR